MPTNKFNYKILHRREKRERRIITAQLYKKKEGQHRCLMLPHLPYLRGLTLASLGRCLCGNTFLQTESYQLR